MFRQLILITAIISIVSSSLIHLDPVQLTLEPSSSTSLKNVVCAVNTLAISSKKAPNSNSFTLSALNPSLCTDLMFVNAAAITNSKLTVVITETMWGEIQSLKNRNPSLRVILTIGGWDAGVKGFQAVGSDPVKLALFADSVVEYLRNHRFIDSISILWMWPTVSYRQGDDKDQNYVTLIANKLYTALNGLPNKPTLGLILPGHLIGPNYRGYDLKKLNPFITTFYILAQDFTGNWGEVTETGHPAPLYGKKQSINATITELFKTLPPEKLVLGLPFFGRSFLLKNAHPNGFNQSHSGGKFKSSFDNDEISIKYQEICHLVHEKKFSVFYDNEAIGQFGVSGKQWVGFDGVESLQEKVAFVEEQGLAGVMPWTIDYDDYTGKYCGKAWALLGGFLPSMEVVDSSTSTGNDTGAFGRQDNNNQGHHHDADNAGHQVNAGDVVVMSMKILVLLCGFLAHISF